jgi:pimeloyl-ACP methyl ester carboxylesterase
MIGAVLFFSIAFEYAHYTRLIIRHKHFNDLRLERTHSDEEQRKMMEVIIKKNPGIFERNVQRKHLAHIVDEDTLYDALTIQNQIQPSNKMCVGRSEIYWRYCPFRVESFFYGVRKLGELYMYFAGFKRSWHWTTDGYYSVYTFHNSNSNERPIVFFPGLGLGAIPYAHIAKRLNRTVYMIEVPNMGYATPLSDRHATAKTIYEVVGKYADEFDIVCHSMGSGHATHLINNLFLKNELYKVKNLIVCDGFVNPVDALINHMYPFVDFCDYELVHKRLRTKREFYMFVYFASQNPEFNSWAKRYHNFYDGVLWRDYNGVNIHYIYGDKDVLYDTDYISQHSKGLVIKNASHGACFFGKRREHTIQHINNLLLI